MDKQEIIKSILRTVEQEVTEWIEEEDTITDALDYEKRLFERSLRIGGVMLAGSKGKVSKDRNAKKKFEAPPKSGKLH